tara:strand:+ start:378 stop:935 length:558 start_codon:yes stop_codon:yes gene_type:complete
MILPIIGYGAKVLRKESTNISVDYPDLNQLIKNMWETMYNAHGVGLAAPQINKNIRLFIIDTTPFIEEGEAEEKAVKQVFINPTIISKDGDLINFNEGCLSIPNIREDIIRENIIEIEYYDEDFSLQKKIYTGIASRVIQHEYDHVEGVLFIDKISPLRKRMIKNKLNDVMKGKVNTSYKIRYIT